MLHRCDAVIQRQLDEELAAHLAFVCVQSAGTASHRVKGSLCEGLDSC